MKTEKASFESAEAMLGSIPVISIDPPGGSALRNLAEVWDYRELLYFLVWRDIKVRYKQTIIGAAWAVIQPLTTMVIFTVIFGFFARIPSDGLPYPIFAYTGLLPWNLFAGALGRASTSVVAQSHLISKIYFPRIIVPLAASIAGIADFGIAFILLIGMMFWFGLLPTWGILAVPFFLLLALLTALAVGLWLSALGARYRDVGHTIPFLTQIWMYASPIVYPVSLVPEKWRLLYGLNPMAGVIEGFRWALLGKGTLDHTLLIVSTLGVVVLLIGGILFFRRMEQTFADVL